MNQLHSISADDFRTFLEQELIRRNSANPNYSLRAFARDLGVDSSFLSKLLSGKRSMTVRTIMNLAPRLGLSESSTQSFSQKASGRRRYTVRNLNQNLETQTYQEIDNQKLTQILEWYHMAILELVSVGGFEANASWIGERLSLSLDQAQQALDDLMSAGVLCQKEDGIWKSELSNHTISCKEYPRMRLVKKQIYEQALAAIPQSLGTHGTMTVAISEKRYEEAVQRIVRFRRELSYFLSEPDEKQKVYQILISLFPVSL